MLSWVHFGDLHASDEDGWQSLSEFERIIDQVNAHVADFVDFAFLPGDNANHGSVEQYERIQACTARLQLPLHVIAGDHDFEPGSLDDFYAGLRARRAPYVVHIDGRPCVFLDVVSAGKGGPDFRLGAAQIDWLRANLEPNPEPSARPVVFMHAFPEDLKADGDASARLFAERDVACVDTGHTHYNEALNDGAVVYTATRSTGQVEEGPVGYSIHAVDGSAVSWRFKDSTSGWPFVLITSPCDRRFVTDPAQRDQVPSSSFVVRAKVFGNDVIDASVTVDGRAAGAMQPVPTERGVWSAQVRDVSDGPHVVRVEARARAGAPEKKEEVTTAFDCVMIDVSSGGARAKGHAGHDLGRHSQSIGRWAERGLMGTQLGPNKNGRKW